MIKNRTLDWLNMIALKLEPDGNLIDDQTRTIHIWVRLPHFTKKGMEGLDAR